MNVSAVEPKKLETQTQVVYKMYEMTQRHVFVNTIYIFHIMQLHSEVLQIIKK